MGIDNNDGGNAWTKPLPGSEGLRSFWWNVVNKFDIQTANDLFEQYSVDKNPQTLGKINELHLDVMKRAAEAELAKLWPEGNRTEIEASMNDPRIPKGRLNEHLPYVLVGYLKNVDKLAAERAAATTAVKQEARTHANNLLTTIPQNGQFYDFDALKLSGRKPTDEPKPKAGEGDKPQTAETKSAATDKPAESQTQREERLSAEFVQKERAKIDKLIAKLPNEARTRISELIKNPNKQNVSEIQKTLGMSGKGSQGVDGRFWKYTLTALEKATEAKPAATEAKRDEAPAAPKPQSEKTAAVEAGTGKGHNAPSGKAENAAVSPNSILLKKAFQGLLRESGGLPNSFVSSENRNVRFRLEETDWSWLVANNWDNWMPIKSVFENKNISGPGLRAAFWDVGMTTMRNLQLVMPKLELAEAKGIIDWLQLKTVPSVWLKADSSQGMKIPAGYEGWTAAYAQEYANKHPYVLQKDR